MVMEPIDPDRLRRFTGRSDRDGIADLAAARDAANPPVGALSVDSAPHRDRGIRIIAAAS